MVLLTILTSVKGPLTPDRSILHGPPNTFHMLLVPEEVDTDGEEEEEGEQEQRGGEEEECGVKAETSRVAENGEDGEKNEVSYPVLIARGVDTNHISDRMRKILLLLVLLLLVLVSN